MQILPRLLVMGNCFILHAGYLLFCPSLVSKLSSYLTSMLTEAFEALLHCTSLLHTAHWRTVLWDNSISMMLLPISSFQTAPWKHVVCVSMTPRELGFSSSGENCFVFFFLLYYFTEHIQEPLFLWQLRNESTSPSYAKKHISVLHRTATVHAAGEAIGSRLCPAWAPHPNIQLPRKQPAAQSIADTTSSSENLTYNENNGSTFSLIKSKQMKR